MASETSCTLLYNRKRYLKIEETASPARAFALHSARAALNLQFTAGMFCVCADASFFFLSYGKRAAVYIDTAAVYIDTDAVLSAKAVFAYIDSRAYRLLKTVYNILRKNKRRFAVFFYYIVWHINGKKHQTQMFLQLTAVRAFVVCFLSYYL